jgi:hypothetical protein
MDQVTEASKALSSIPSTAKGVRGGGMNPRSQTAVESPPYLLVQPVIGKTWLWHSQMTQPIPNTATSASHDTCVCCGLALRRA